LPTPDPESTGQLPQQPSPPQDASHPTFPDEQYFREPDRREARRQYVRVDPPQLSSDQALTQVGLVPVQHVGDDAPFEEAFNSLDELSWVSRGPASS
jgi:hypothetical protein